MSTREAFVPPVAPSRLKERLVRPIADFAQKEATSGLLLMATAVIALLWANIHPGSYYDVWHAPLGLQIGTWRGELDAHHFVNDVFMAVFFLLVGLEIKREFLIGELADRARATLPIAAAVGGMVVPAAIYAFANRFPGGDVRGTGVPMATDIAFSLGVLSLLGRRVPLALKVFLAAVAIVDDLGAVAVIAAFYTEGLRLDMLAGAAFTLVSLFALNRLGVRNLLPYLALGTVLWAFTFASGVHATVAGVLLAFTVPVFVAVEPVRFAADAREAVTAFEEAVPSRQNPNLMNEDRQIAVRELELSCERIQMPLERLEDALQPWVAYLILPVFALANAGVALASAGSGLLSPPSVGIILGLCVGKPAGIVLGAYFAMRYFGARMPAGTNPKALLGVGALCGIGFTMSLFISGLAFSPERHEQAKAAILLASVVMGVVGYVALARALPQANPEGRTDA